MNCKEFKELIQDYIDNEFDNSVMMTSETKKEFEDHMEACPTCKAEVAAYQKIINSIHALKPEKLPEGYCNRLNNKIKSARFGLIRKKHISFTKYIGIAAAFVLVVFAVNFAINNFGGYSNSPRGMAMRDEAKSIENKSDSGYYGKSEIATEPSSPAPERPMSEAQYDGNEMAKGNMAGTSDLKQSLFTAKMAPQDKIIKSGSLYIETMEFDKLVEGLTQEIKDKNGYIENSEISIREKRENKSYRYASLNLRIPQESFEDVVKFIEEKSEVNRKNISENDVTKDYYDKQNVMTNLEIQESRLRELYDKAENITEILALENEIRRIRTEIDSYSIDLRNIDDRVNMATIQLSVSEIGDNELNIKAEDGLWTRAKKGFVRTVNNIIDFIQSVVIWMVSYIIFIIPLIIVGIIIYRHIRKTRRS